MGITKMNMNVMEEAIGYLSSNGHATAAEWEQSVLDRGRAYGNLGDCYERP